MEAAFRRLLVGAFLLGFALATTPSGSTRAEDALEQKIDRLVKRQGIGDDGPGVAVWIHQPGKLSFRKGYGLADLKSATPITPHTMFELASNSKPFTAAAVLLLAQRGKLALDDDVRTYVPELPAYSGGPIRIRNLLHHTSGLPEYLEFDEVPARHGTWWDNDDYVAAFAGHPADFPVGRRYEYNNSNYMLLATIIARVSKKSYGTFLRDEIFAPVGMKQTFVYESPTSPPDPVPKGYERAIGYEPGKKQPWRAAWGAPPARHEKSLSVGDGGVWTNLHDMAAWDAAQRGATLLSAATLEASRRPSHTADGRRNDYGLGWELEMDEGRLIGYGHSGSWGGFRTSYYRDLTKDRTIVILSNRGNFSPDDFWESLDALVTKHLER